MNNVCTLPKKMNKHVYDCRGGRFMEKKLELGPVFFNKLRLFLLN